MRTIRQLAVAAGMTWLVVIAANAGSITGQVHAEGKPGAEPDAADGGKYASRALKFAERVDYPAMHDFVVYIVGPMTNAPVTAVTNAEVTTETNVTQKNAFFSPHVLPVVVGTTVAWPNKDDIYHNVFSYSDTKPFDLGLYKDSDKIPPKTVTFDKTGRVDVFCSIHSTMNCVVLVLENSYFARTRDNGSYKIDNVPAGTYQLKAWHERLPPQVHEITVPEHGEVKADFTLTITGLPKY